MNPAISRSKKPCEFIAHLAGEGYKNGAGAIDMLSHIFPEGILNEQNCFTDYREIVQALSTTAPIVFQVYKEASPDILGPNRIAPMARFQVQASHQCNKE